MWDLGDLRGLGIRVFARVLVEGNEGLRINWEVMYIFMRTLRVVLNFWADGFGFSKFGAELRPSRDLGGFYFCFFWYYFSFLRCWKSGSRTCVSVLSIQCCSYDHQITKEITVSHR